MSKKSNKVPAADETKAVAIVPAAPAAKPAAPTGPRKVFTVGYQGLKGPMFLEYLARHGITTVLDTRSPTLAKQEGPFNQLVVKSLIQAHGVAYTQWCSTPKIATAIAGLQGNVLLLRREKCPGDSVLHMEFGRYAAAQKPDPLTVVHLYEDEEIEACEYARSIIEGRDYVCVQWTIETAAPAAPAAPAAESDAAE
jgi:hypothetical protein